MERGAREVSSRQDDVPADATPEVSSEAMTAETRDIQIGLGRWIAASVVGGALAVAVGSAIMFVLRQRLPGLGPEAGVGPFGGIAAARLASIVVSTLASGAVCGAAYRAVLGPRRGAWPMWVTLGCVGSLLFVLVALLVLPTIGPVVPQTTARAGIQVIYCGWMSLFLRFCMARPPMTQI